MSDCLDLKKRVLAFIEGGHSKVEISMVFNGGKCALFLLDKRTERARGSKIEIKLKLRDLRPYTIDAENREWGIEDVSEKKSYPLFKGGGSLFSWGCLRTFLYQFFIPIFYTNLLYSGAPENFP